MSVRVAAGLDAVSSPSAPAPSAPAALAPFPYLQHPTFKDVVSNLDPDDFTALVGSEGVGSECAGSECAAAGSSFPPPPTFPPSPTWWCKLRLQYTFDRNGHCAVQNVEQSQAIAARLACQSRAIAQRLACPRRTDSDADNTGSSYQGALDSLFVVGEITEGMTGCSFIHTYAEYREMVESSRALAARGEGRLLERLRALEAEKGVAFEGEDFYRRAVKYLLRKAERHGVQVEFGQEWEWFLCARVLCAEGVGRVRLEGGKAGEGTEDVDGLNGGGGAAESQSEALDAAVFRGEDLC